MAKFFSVLAFIGIILASGAGLYWYIDRGGVEVRINEVLPDRIMLGIPFTIKVIVGNDGNGVLADARVALECGEGCAFVGSQKTKTIETKSVGDVGSGGTTEVEFRLVAGLLPHSVRKGQVIVSYVPKGLSARFEKIKEINIPIGDVGLTLDMVLPDKVTSGEEVSIELSYKNVSDVDIRDIELTVDYPAGFEYKRAELAPDIAKNVWRLGDLRRGSAMRFKIFGNIIGAASAHYNMKASTSAVWGDERYSLTEVLGGTTIGEAPLETNFTINEGGNDMVVGLGDELRYRVVYTNKSSGGLKNGVIHLDIKGDMFDGGSIVSSGQVNDARNAVVWFPVSGSPLSAIGPGASGEVTVRVKVKNAYTIKRLSDKNYTLKAEVRMEMVGGGNKKILSIARLENKIKGMAAIDTRVYFRDAESGIINSGPIPPRVGAPTNYTVHWVLKNFATDIRDVAVVAQLPGNARFTGTAKSTLGEAPVYDAVTGNVRWHIDRLFATRGILGEAPEAIFQIEVIPSSNTAKNYVPLIGETTFQAHDEFTGLTITGGDIAVTSSLPDDPTIGPLGGIVVE